MKASVAVASWALEAAGHGWIQIPVSKNEMQAHHHESGMPTSLQYEPQTCYWGNQAGKRIDGEGYSCGAKEAAEVQGLDTWQKWYDAAGVAVPTITPGQELSLQIKITADHGGQSWLMIACSNHIGEDVDWTYLERAAGDRDHHFMPSNPGIYAWAMNEAASSMHSTIKATWVVPKTFSCASGKVVGRWLWKTGNSCNDMKNIGRPTQTFNKSEFGKVVHDFSPGAWIQEQCTAPPETFISCLDFKMTDELPSQPAVVSPPPSDSVVAADMEEHGHGKPCAKALIRGFWFGYAGSASKDAAPSNGWFFSFPGLVVKPPFAGSKYGPILSAPSWGTYEKKILTQGGGATGWGDSVYATMKSQIQDYKPAGWDGVCWDWETAAADHTTEGFNALMKAAQDAGLINIVTSTAEGPYEWSAASKDATGIDWSLVDYFAPQMYGAAGTLPSEWKTYAQYWKDGANKPNVHGVTFGPIPMEKFLWAMPVGTCQQAQSEFGGAGCVEWVYSPSVTPPHSAEVIV